MQALLIRAIGQEDGQDLIEYGLLIGIITVASLLAITSMGGKVTQYFTNLNAAMP
jgi:pilus assembly protein Flp/PilA